MSFMEINDDDSIKPSHVADKDTTHIVYSKYNCLKLQLSNSENEVHPINLMKYQTHIDIRRLTPNSLEL